MKFTYASPPLPAAMPILSGAVELTGPRNMCFHRSVAFVLDVPGSSLFVGTFRAATPEERLEHPEYSAVPFIHCWAEFQGNIYAPTTIEMMEGVLAPMNKLLYLAMNGAENIKRLPRSKVQQLADRFDIVEHLTKDWKLRHGRKFADIFLEVMDVDYELSPQKGVVPKGTFAHG